MAEHWMIDRFEENYAVCERADGSTVDVDRSSLPEGVAEGDCLILDQNGEWSIDRDATEARRIRLARRTRALFKRSEVEQ